MKNDRSDKFVWDDGDVTIEFPKKDENKKAKKFNEVVENKKGDENDEEQ